MKKLILLFTTTIFFILLSYGIAGASHLAGAEITYESKGGLDYEITLFVYQRCDYFMSTSAYVNYSSDSSNVDSLAVLLVSGPVDVLDYCPGDLNSCNGGTKTGIYEYVFKGIVTLPSYQSDWVFSWFQGDRITTTGISGFPNIYVETKLNNNLGLAGIINNSPVFFKTSPTLLNVFGINNLDFGGTDPDGDMLFYTLIDPLQSSGIPISYINALSFEQPLMGPVVVQDFNFTTTGQFTYDATGAGQSSAIAILVEEYRDINQTLERVGSTIRDIYLVVDSCPIPPDLTSYCCDSNYQILTENFENGSSNFTSDYTEVLSDIGSPLPGQFAFFETNQIFPPCNQWSIQDHTICEGVIAPNFKVMIVNGRTQQGPGNLVRTIYQTTIFPDTGCSYVFCVYLQHLPTCCFDQAPYVKFEIEQGNGWETIHDWTQIIGDPLNLLNPCDWQNVKGNFTATSQVVNIRIRLWQGPNGDGNDLALDDISVSKLEVTDHTITVTDQIVNGDLIVTASAEELVSAECQYRWCIVEMASISPATFVPGSLQCGNYMTGPPTVQTFSSYPFELDKLYRIYFIVDSCCCYANDTVWEYSGGGLKMMQELGINNLDEIELDPKQERELMRQIFGGNKGVLPSESEPLNYVRPEINKMEQAEQAPQPTLGQNIPNPFDNSTSINYYIPEGMGHATIKVYDATSREVRSMNLLTGNGTAKIKSDGLNAGVYHYSLIIAGKLFESRKMVINK